MGLALGFTVTQAAAAPGSAPAASAQVSKNYTCDNQGGGPTARGPASAPSTFLSGTDLTLLQNVLDDVIVKVANLDVDTQIKQIEASDLHFYISKLLIPITADKIQVVSLPSAADTSVVSG